MAESQEERKEAAANTRSRKYCFTLNNYTEEELDTISTFVEDKKLDFVLYGKEVGA